MAQGKGHSGARREPVFDSCTRIARRGERPPRRLRQTRQTQTRKPAAQAAPQALADRAGDLLEPGARAVARHRRRRRHRLDRRAYAAAAVAGNSQAAAFDPDRGRDRPSARHPRRQRRRRVAAERNAEIRSAGLHRHRGSPLLPALRRRSFRHRARADRQHPAPRRGAGRLHHHAAIGEEPLSHARAHRPPQAAGDAAGAVAGAQIHQDADSRTVFEPRLLSVPAPTASNKLRSAISANPPRI